MRSFARAVYLSLSQSVLMAGADKDESLRGRRLAVPIDWNVIGAQREEEVVADIFISYAREDRVAASRLADRFGDEGWTVFWDRDLIAGDN